MLPVSVRGAAHLQASPCLWLLMRWRRARRSAGLCLDVLLGTNLTGEPRLLGGDSNQLPMSEALTAVLYTKAADPAPL